MTAARAIEYRITRNLINATSDVTERGLAERIIAIAAGAVGLLLFGSLLPGLAVAGVLASTVVVLSL